MLNLVNVDRIHQSRRRMKQNWLGDIEHLERFEPFIDHDSVTQLKDYFRLGGLARFEKSPLATQLYRAEMYASNIAPCLYCGGTRHSEDPSLDVGGAGFIMMLSSLTPTMLSRVKREIGREAASTIQLTDGVDCPVCNKTGWVVTSRRKSGGEQLTAKPNGMASPGMTHDSDIDVALGTCAFVARIIDKADVLFPMTTTVLASCFGPVNYGSIGVWHLTPAGKTLLRRNSTYKDEVLFFVGLKNEAEAKCDKTLSAQLKAAETQASAAIDAAYKAWNAALFVHRCGI